MIRGVGIDLVEKERMVRAVRRWGERFLERVFTGRELDGCPEGEGWMRAITVRFAAKEAVLKALGTGWGEGVVWKDVEVGSESEERPEVRLSGRAKDMAKGCRVRLHLSDGGRTVMAFALVEIREE